MTFEFISRVLLDFELWKDAAFTVQLAIVEMVSRIIDKGYHAKLPSNIHLTLFEQLMSVTFDSYKLEESYGGVKPAEKLLLKKTALDALIKLINYNGDRAVTHKQFCQCMGRICRAAESDNKLEQYLRDAILVAVKNILSPHYKENNKKYHEAEWTRWGIRDRPSSSGGESRSTSEECRPSGTSTSWFPPERLRDWPERTAQGSRRS